MKVILTEAEINEAILEWCQRRGLPVTKKTKVGYRDTYRGSDVTTLVGVLDDIQLAAPEVAPKDTPYR